MFQMKGTDSTLGLQKRLNSPAPFDAVTVKVLMQLGAVPFVKTNIPQLCLRLVYYFIENLNLT